MILNILRKSTQKGIGGKGENLAAQFLRKKHYKVIESNWRNAKGKQVGEIDIIARDSRGELVFVEVKSLMMSGGDNIPEQAITPAKLQKCAKAAELYIKEHALWEETWKIDAIAIVFEKNRKNYSIKHIKSIFY